MRTASFLKAKVGARNEDLGASSEAFLSVNGCDSSRLNYLESFTTSSSRPGEKLIGMSLLETDEEKGFASRRWGFLTIGRSLLYCFTFFYLGDILIFGFSVMYLS